MSRRIVSVLVLVVAIGVIGGACGDGGGNEKDATKAATEVSTPMTGTPSADGTPKPTTGGSADARAIEALIHSQTDAHNDKSVDVFVAAFSDSYYDDLGVSRGDARALVATFIGVPHVDITSISAIKVSGDNATAQIDSSEGVILSSEKYSFVRETGQWKIAKIEELPVDVDTTNAVDLNLVEYDFVFDENAAKDGDVVFNVSNAGAQAHEVELMRLPDGVSAQDVRDREDLPDGVETIGLFGPLDPGESRTMAFASTLGAGSYALVCYLSDAGGQSHASLGMTKDLTVS